MVSKKKRPPPAIETSDTVTKKSKSSEGAGTSSGTSVVSTPKTPKRAGGSTVKAKVKVEEVQESNQCGTDGFPLKSPKRGGGSTSKAKGKVEEEVQPEQEEVPENNPCGSEDFPDWTPNDLLELMKRMERVIPGSDTLQYKSRTEKLDWQSVSFGCHTAQECKDTWLKIQMRLRKFRLLRELLEDAKVWAAKPWTHFYRSQKQNRHPDMPRKPLTSYMLFYLATKDKVSKEHPGLEMTEISKYIAEMYKSLPDKKKKKYTEMSAAQRKSYDEKIQEFYQEHPELLPKHDKSDSRIHIGPKKPLPPYKLFLEDKLKRHKNDSGFDKSSFVEKCKEQWRSMPDKKKVIWINWACEEEARYIEELKAYMSQNPEFVPGNVKAVLTKEEKTLRERVAGKPEKPPNSGYSLFSRLMLASDHMKDFAPKERMTEISRMWKNLPETQKKKYQERVNHLLDQYKLEYATYLESLPEDKRQEELQSNMPKSKRPAKPKAAATTEEKKNTNIKVSNHPKIETPGLYKGEPEPPPRNEYLLFLKALLNDKSKVYSEKAAPNLWQMLPDAEKAKYRKKLNDIKTKYIQDYEKFLNSLSQEQLKEYSARKESSKKEHAEASEESGKEDDSSSSDDEDDDEEDQDSGSDDSSSDSESGSSDSSDSNDGDSKNSGDSSSSVSDSE